MKNSTKYYLSLLVVAMLFSCGEKESIEPEEEIVEEEFVPPVTVHELIQGSWDLAELHTQKYGITPLSVGEVIFSFSKDSLYFYNIGELNSFKDYEPRLYVVDAECRNEADSLCEIIDQYKTISFYNYRSINPILELDSLHLLFGEGYQDGRDYYLKRRSFEEYVPEVSD